MATQNNSAKKPLAKKPLAKKPLETAQNGAAKWSAARILKIVVVGSLIMSLAKNVELYIKYNNATELIFMCAASRAAYNTQETARTKEEKDKAFLEQKEVVERADALLQSGPVKEVIKDVEKRAGARLKGDEAAQKIEGSLVNRKNADEREKEPE